MTSNNFVERIVQKEIRVKKCIKCDEYGRITKRESVGSIYYPYCKCEYGRWLRDHEIPGDMFYQARHGL